MHDHLLADASILPLAGLSNMPGTVFQKGCTSLVQMALMQNPGAYFLISPLEYCISSYVLIKKKIQLYPASSENHSRFPTIEL